LSEGVRIAALAGEIDHLIIVPGSVGIEYVSEELMQGIVFPEIGIP